jgi:hypothetical protein
MTCRRSTTIFPFRNQRHAAAIEAGRYDLSGSEGEACPSAGRRGTSQREATALQRRVLVSLVLCLGLLGLWVRSYWVWNHARVGRTNAAIAISERGQITLVRMFYPIARSERADWVARPLDPPSPTDPRGL